MKKTYPELPNWSFDIDEVSANIYKVVGTDKYGHTVSATGTDLERLVEQCKEDARKIDRTLERGSDG